MMDTWLWRIFEVVFMLTCVGYLFVATAQFLTKQDLEVMAPYVQDKETIEYRLQQLEEHHP